MRNLRRLAFCLFCEQGERGIGIFLARVALFILILRGIFFLIFVVLGLFVEFSMEIYMKGGINLYEGKLLYTGRFPNKAEPMRRTLEPNCRAVLKSLDMPMESFGRPACFANFANSAK